MLKLFNHFTEKYHFSEQLVEIYLEAHYKSILFNAGKYENKSIGKQSYQGIKNKSIRDFIHYLASQHPYFRRLIRLKKTLYLNLKNWAGSLM